MKRPELILFACGQSRYGRLPGIFVVSQGKMFDNQFELIRILFQHLLKKWLQPSTVRSLIVIEDGYNDRRIGRTHKGQAGNINIVNSIHSNHSEDIRALAR